MATDTGPFFDTYAVPGGREMLLRFGPDRGPVAILALPLFEEANRTRRLAVGMLHRLAARGIAGMLPDVPGQGESLAPLATIHVMARAMEALADRCAAEGRRSYGVGIRSGALLDRTATHHGRWHLAPQTGAALLRELHRQWLTAGHRGSLEAMMQGGDRAVEIAGNRLPIDLLTGLIHAEPHAEAGVPQRTVRLAGDPRPADRVIAAPPPWRRSEPGDEPDLALRLADDIADWIAACEA